MLPMEDILVIFLSFGRQKIDSCVNKFASESSESAENSSLSELSDTVTEYKLRVTWNILIYSVEKNVSTERI